MGRLDQIGVKNPISMETLIDLFNLFLHLDKHLKSVIATYGGWTYLLLFLIVFCETGLVITPFLPGDSLLFAAGTFAALGVFRIEAMVLLLIAAAVLGDTVNYWLGHYIGPRAFTDRIPLLKRQHLVRTHNFYERHGGKTIILARFVPIIRTFAPFVAGIGAMSYRRFLIYNVVGGVVWVVLFAYGGYLLGNLPVIKRNFSLVVMLIVMISVMPMVIEFLKHKFTHRQDSAQQ